MTQWSETSDQSLHKLYKLLTFVIIFLVIACAATFFVNMRMIRAGDNLTSLPTFYFMLFIPILIGIILNRRSTIGKEIKKRNVS